jgi:hypothetical protein
MTFGGRLHMKKIRYVVISAMMIIGLLGSTVVKAESSVDDLVNYALTNKTFYNYNIAYSAIMKVQDTSKRDPYLWKLASISQDVLTPAINNFTIKLDELCKTSNAKLYDQIVADVSISNLTDMDKGYLLGELTGWGKQLVYTPDYVNGLNQLIGVWGQLENPDADNILTKAENEIKNIKNDSNRQYLLEELQKARSEKNKKEDVVKKIREIGLSDRPDEQKISELKALLSSTNVFKIPSNYLEGDEFSRLTGYLAYLNWRNIDIGFGNLTVEKMQRLISGAVTYSETSKFKGNITTGGYIDLKANNSNSDIDITDQVFVFTSPLSKGVGYSTVVTGFLRGDGSRIPSDYLVLQNGRIYLKAKPVESGFIDDSIIIKVTYNNEEEGSISQVRVRIYP